MPELHLTSVGDSTFAVRGDRVDRVVEVPSISRPMRLQRPDLIAVVVDERVLYFCDLAARLGIGEPLVDRGTGLIIRDGESVAGIAVARPPRTVEVSDGELVQIDAGIGQTIIESCARVDGEFVPLLSDAFLGSLSDETLAQWSLTIDSPGTPAEIQGEHLVEVRAAGRSIAITHGDSTPVVVEVDQMIRLPGAPPYIAGLSFFGGSMRPVIDLAQLLGLGTTATDPVVFAWTSADQTLLVVADALASPLPAGVVMAELPPLLRDGAIGRAALIGHSVLPVVDLHAAIATRRADTTRETRVDSSYRLDSDFPGRFLASEVTVHEFALGQSVYAIPEDELAELETSSEIVPTATTGALISGAVRVDDRVVPVIDLPAYLGYRIDDTPTEAGLLVRNGDFEAAFFPHRSLGKRTIDPSVQRELPLASTRPFVYGCYVDGSDVRLILNVALIAQFAQDPATQQALAGLVPSPATPESFAALRGGPAHDSPRADDTSHADDATSRGDATPPTDSTPAGDSALATETPSSDAMEHPAVASGDDRSPDGDVPGPGEAFPQGDATPGLEAKSPADTPPPQVDVSESDSVEIQAPPDEPVADDSAPDDSSPERSATPNPEPRRRARRSLLVFLLLLLLVAVVGVGVVFGPSVIDQALNDRPIPEQSQRGESVSRSPEPSPAPSGSGIDGPQVARSLSVRVSFDADSAELKSEARRALDQFVAELSERDGLVLTVVGHAARVGSEVSSQTLSEERARVTAAHIVRRLGVEPKSVVVRGAGARQPVAGNETEAGRSRNRRAEVQVMFE